VAGFMQKKILALFLTAVIGIFPGGLILGCNDSGSEPPEAIIEDNFVPLARIEPTFNIPVPDAPGTLAESNDLAFIDYSNMHLGYVTVGFPDETDKKLKALKIVPGGNEYIYNLTPGVNEVLPLSKGNGSYTISMHEQVEDNIFRVVLRVTIEVELLDEFIPFLNPNQYVHYNKESPLAAKALELNAERSSFISIVEAIYNFVVENISYDFEHAETVDFGYIPDLSTILERRTGICFDIAALTTAMLRSQGIPAKLVVGYYYDPVIGNTYHAWVSVFAEEDGWIGEHIFFTGGTWNLLDPTILAILAVSDPVSSSDDGKIYHALYYY